ncbi:MAG: hypothetical protein AAF493_07575 [Pseudomonadota bacterium]
MNEVTASAFRSRGLPKPGSPIRAFLITCLLCGLWINASEIFRYFVFVMPMLRESLSVVRDVAPMNWTVFAIWGLWDTILVLVVTGFVWIFLDRFGRSLRNAVIAGTLAWVAIFVILWLGMYNMNLASPKLLGVALPLSWLELVVAALIVGWGMRRFSPPIDPRPHTSASAEAGLAS